MSMVKDYLSVSDRFNRSIRLERDFFDPSAMEAYVVTEEVRKQVNRLMKGLDAESGQRAWRITGDYGSGKSSFALLLAHLFFGDDKKIPALAWAHLDKEFITSQKRGYLTILITGSRAPIRKEVVKGLIEALSDPLFFGGEVPDMVSELREQAEEFLALDLTDRDLVDLIRDINEKLIKKGFFKGMFIIIDELGKFLEYAADNPEEQDVFFLQELAESASRSRSKPLFVLGILHQGLASYAKSAGPQKELEKVAGRFEEIVFRNSISQVATLTSEALGGENSKAPAEYADHLRSAMSHSVDLGIFGSSAPQEYFQELADRTYPLHPTILPIMHAFFSKFGQNERSLFGFFVSQEPFALNAFADRDAGPAVLYRLSDFYDYAATNFGHLLGAGSFSTHWNHVESLIRSFRTGNEIEEKVIKTVGMLDFMARKEMRAVNDVVCLCLDQYPAEQIRDTLSSLRQRGVLFSRGQTNEYRLWDHSSVNLETSYEKAWELSKGDGDLVKRLKDFGLLSERPLVARRHFVETGNLRHFEVKYLDVEDLEREMGEPVEEADGRLLIPICESKEELNKAKELASLQPVEDGLPKVIGISSQPLRELDELIRKCAAWKWIAENEGGLKDDRFAAEEVSRALVSAQRELQRNFQASLGLGHGEETEGRYVSWYRNGKIASKGAGRKLHSYLSDLCDEIFPDAPRIVNELINRRKISAAARSASNRLIQRLFENADQAELGFPEDKAPPEKSMYLSTLSTAGVHVKSGDSEHKLVMPQAGNETDPCHLNPLFSRLLDLLESKPDERIRVDKLFKELKKPPYGVRDGLLPILLAVLVICRRNQIALYYEGTFESEIDHNLFQVLAKKPEIFELQSCKIEGLRVDVLEQIYGILKKGSEHQPTDLLEVVKPLCGAIAGLSEYVRKTGRLSPIAKKVRDSILNAADPSKLLFSDLPEALGLEPFGQDMGESESHEAIARFVQELEKSLEELRHALNKLRERLQLSMLRAFEKKDSLENFAATRRTLSTQAESIAITTANIDLKAFSLRIMDSTKSDFEWIDSVASLLANSPPDKWLNQHEDKFEDRLGELVGRFMRAEQLTFANGTNADSTVEPVRISLTRKDGSEKGRVLHLNESESKKARKLAMSIKEQLPDDRLVALAALYDLFWEMMPEDNDE